jgi:hypothetical protein
MQKWPISRYYHYLYLDRLKEITKEPVRKPGNIIYINIIIDIITEYGKGKIVTVPFLTEHHAI